MVVVEQFVLKVCDFIDSHVEGLCDFYGMHRLFIEITRPQCIHAISATACVGQNLERQQPGLSHLERAGFYSGKPHTDGVDKFLLRGHFCISGCSDGDK
jgi:hypothetical protein